LGAFLLYNNNLSILERFSARKSSVLKLFSDLRLPDQRVFYLGNYCLHLYGKRNFSTINFYHDRHNNFIASTGTLIYNGCYGEEGLKLLLRDFLNEKKIEDNCRGNYFVIIYSSNKLCFFRDYYGLYPVYTTDDYSIISSTFLAIVTLIKDVTISKEELFEYLFNGYWYGKQTLFKEVKILAEGCLINPDQASSIKKFKPYFFPVKALPYNTLLSKISENVKKQFRLIHSGFGENICQGLSGGYDSRLILAGLLSNNVKPYLYVNGTPGSNDIDCASKIAEQLNFNIDIVHFYEGFDNDVRTVEEKIHSRFLFFDGLGVSGVFDKHTDFEYRIQNPLTQMTNLNGSGGEIYREAWNIPDKMLTIESFLKARYDKYNFSSILVNYSKKEYLCHIQELLENYLPTSKRLLERRDLELLHPLRYKAIHFILTTQQFFIPFLLPFYEPSLIKQSLDIPVKYKLNGIFNKDLIRNIFPVLTSFPTSYGYTFNDNVPILKKLQESLIRNTPLTLRPYLRHFKKSKKLPVDLFSKNLLDLEIKKKLVKISDYKIGNYINLRKVTDYNLLSRALTLEMLLNYTEIN